MKIMTTQFEQITLGNVLLLSDNPDENTIRNPSYLNLLYFEKEVDFLGWVEWHSRNKHLAHVATCIYLVTIFGIKYYMEKRKAYDLRRVLVAWNFGLALFSTLGFFRMLPGLLYIMDQPNGVYRSICTKQSWNGATIFWGLVFGLSKFAELGDTIFVVLRKRKLNFLHYYHHVTVLCYSWASAASGNSSSHWFATINYGVHSLMYSYYTAKAARVDVAKPVAMLITGLQLFQMLCGIGINVFILAVKVQGHECNTKSSDIYYAFAMYLSYALLFGKFFVKAYLKGHDKLD